MVLGVVGLGPFSVVYLARDGHGQVVAVKCFRLPIDAGPDPAPLVLRDAEAVRRVPVTSPHLARVLEAGMEGGVAWLARDYVDGLTLGAAVGRYGPLTAAGLRVFAAGSAAALATLHAAGVRHGNLKPANVLLAATGPVVVDAGIGRYADPTVVQPDQILASSAYLAPEQVTGQTVTTAADVHSWGALVVFAGTGKPPFTGDWPQVLSNVLNAQPELGGLDGDLRELAAAALAKDPARRPTASELSQHLHA
jgi:eukaryotic-like serine/threonine-protein kinase